MDTTTLTSLFNARKGKHNIDFEPKPEQIEIAASIYNGKNTLGFLPTGFGKTLCYVINSIISEKKKMNLVISPLLSLMDDQIRALSKWNFKCVKIAHDTPHELVEKAAGGEYDFVFASPESILKPFWRKVFRSDTWQSCLECIVFDEAHCLTEWGEDFRPEYAEMAQLRSFFKVPILAVTATCTQKVLDGIVNVLHLDASEMHIVSKLPDRENINILCQKRKSTDIEMEFSWLTDHIETYKEHSKKIIIYCRSIDAVSNVFMTLKSVLGLNAYKDSIPDSNHLLIEMFHKCTQESSKKRILQSFSGPNSTLRCVVATVALGMGVDIKDIDLVVHYGCPTSVISYWQEAGRCARDGRIGLSLILYDNFTAALKTTDPAMSNIVKQSANECIRQNVMDVFNIGERHKFNNTACSGCDALMCMCDACKCCSFCAAKCQCSTKGQRLSLFLNRN